MDKSVLAAIFIMMSGLGGVAQTAQQFSEESPAFGAVNIVVSNLESEGNAYFSDAELSERSGRYDEAITLFSKAAFEYNSSNQLSRYGLALMRLSNVHYLMNHYVEAEQVVLNVALKNYAKMGSKMGQMESYGQLGRIYLASEQLTQSLWFYTQQGILARQLRNSGAHIESVLGIANVKIRKREYRMASDDLNQAEALARASNNSRYATKIKQARALIQANRSKS
ncbi:hypothetical protein [Pedobacter deserti]|uniref:hypothetical protein n=1 Tax=Pedobacter deserti TaxID=2817382 RepID=UPI00210A4535|nr:hypothetical protein [Pedobacter sp. SYSU D00382]